MTDPSTTQTPGFAERLRAASRTAERRDALLRRIFGRRSRSNTSAPEPTDLIRTRDEYVERMRNS